MSKKKTVETFPEISHKTVVRTVNSGEIRLEIGADGTFILFDCDCLDALPYCKAQCCGLKGTFVTLFESEENNLPIEFDEEFGANVMQRDSDGFCSCLNRRTRTCDIYENRPQVCKDFHCTKGASQRGWKLKNEVIRQSKE